MRQKVEEKTAHLSPEAGESGSTSLGIKCETENRILTKQTDYCGINLNVDCNIKLTPHANFTSKEKNTECNYIKLNYFTHDR